MAPSGGRDLNVDDCLAMIRHRVMLTPWTLRQRLEPELSDSLCQQISSATLGGD